MPNGYTQWRKDIEQLIDTAKLHTALSVNVGTLTLYWNIGKSILQKQEREGWGQTGYRATIKRFNLSLSR